MRTLYYDLHVNEYDGRGFSVPVKMQTNLLLVQEKDIVNYAIQNNLLDLEDAKHVDYIDEIEEKDYKQMMFI